MVFTNLITLQYLYKHIEINSYTCIIYLYYIEKSKKRLSNTYNKGEVVTKVSVIIPVYNTAKFLERCLNSLVEQTLKAIEIICIDDGSTDNSIEILETFSKNDNRIKIFHTEHFGPSFARNLGISNAHGEYISFVDSDDWLDKNFLENLYYAAISTNSDISVGGIIRQHKFNRTIKLSFDKILTTDDVNLKFELCDVPELSYVWNKIYKLEKLKNLNLKFEEGIFFEDCIFTPQVLFYTDKMTVVPDSYYHYWRRNDSIVSCKNEKIIKDSKYAHDKARKFIKDNNIDIASHEPMTYRFKLFGITLFKIRAKGNKKQYTLFQFIKIGSFE